MLPFSIYRLVGDVLVSTAFLSYSGPFNQDFRGHLFKNWFKELKNRKIPFTLNLNTIDMLVDANTVSFVRHPDNTPQPLYNTIVGVHSINHAS